MQAKCYFSLLPFKNYVPSCLKKSCTEKGPLIKNEMQRKVDWGSSELSMTKWRRMKPTWFLGASRSGIPFIISTVSLHLNESCW